MLILRLEFRISSLGTQRSSGISSAMPSVGGTLLMAADICDCLVLENLLNTVGGRLLFLALVIFSCVITLVDNFFLINTDEALFPFIPLAVVVRTSPKQERLSMMAANALRYLSLKKA